MADIPLPLYETSALWQVRSFGHLAVPPTRRHWWDNADRTPLDIVTFQVVLEGRLHVVFLGERTVLAPGDGFLFGHGEASAYGLPDKRSQTYVCEWVCLRGEGLPAHWLAYRRQFGSVIRGAVRTPAMAQMRRLIELADIRSSTRPPEMARAVHGFVMALFEQAEAARTDRQRAVDRAVEQILRHPTAPWSLKAVAHEYGVSREHLCRVFTQRMGQSPREHLAAVRLRMAMQLLRETDLELSQIARQTGFINGRALASQVKREIGQSPRAWRRGL